MHEPGENGGRFVIQRDGRAVAELVYSGTGPIVTLEHTQVDSSMRGTGAGKTLVAEAVQWARASGKRLVARCPYAKSVFDKTPDYQDVLAAHSSR
jgi:predicted GNAT family acetyltransferase